MSSAASQHRRRRSSRTTFAAIPTPPTPWLVLATDAGLFGALVLVPGCLGGRTPTGHLMLVLVASWTVLCWSLHRVLSTETRWTWSNTEGLWVAAIVLVGLQLTEFSPAWLDWLSPQHRKLLGTETFRTSDEVLWESWTQLSMAPGETTSALATLLAYSLLFFVGMQRFHQHADLEKALRAIALITIGWAVFSLVHYFCGNGRFFWVFVHPQVATTDYNTGPFITRNHFAHFLALGSGPLLWWWLSPTGGSESLPKPATQSFGAVSAPVDLRQFAFAGALVIVVLAGVLTLSRGGMAAMGISMFVTLLALNQHGRVTASFLFTLSAAGAIIGTFAVVGGADALAKRIDSHSPEMRHQIWQANIELAKLFPLFGTGVGTHASAHRLFVDLSDRGQVYTHAESSYLQVASECGLVGLVLAALMIFLAVKGPLRTLFRSDNRDGAIAAAVFGSLAAHLLHCAVDFLWYAPGCMVVIVMLAAIGRRIAQLSAGINTDSHPPRLVWTAAMVMSVALGGWMIREKLPAARAEGAVTTYRLLAKQLDDDAVASEPDEVARIQRERARVALQIHRMDPAAGKWSAIAATQYLRLFDLKQEQGEQPMSLVMLRDAVNSSEWDSPEATRNWIGRVTGKNHKWLDAAWQAGLDAVRREPLEGPAYLHLARLSFLKDPSGALQRKLVGRALRVRPYDADILIAAGQEIALNGDLSQAIHYWKQAFPRGEEYQRKIAMMLAPTQSPDELVAAFDPDWRACLVLSNAYAAAGREPEWQQIQRHVARAAVESARALQDSRSVPAWIAAFNAHRELGEADAAIAILREAASRDPNQFEIRRALGAQLLMLERYAEAAEHLRWASMRRPDDADLRDATELAIRESHRAPSPVSQLVTPAGLMPAWQEPTVNPVENAAWPPR
jgi:O-antigen ligase/tetratricopeptide (TPR) repeat protein